VGKKYHCKGDQTLEQAAWRGCL